MIGSLIVLVISFVLFVYWFRYTCLLILSAKPAKDYSLQVAETNGMAFPDVRRQLGDEPAVAQMRTLQESLERDYRILNYLLRHAKDLEVNGVSIEQHMLAVDYQIMKLFYGASRRLGIPGSRRALREMADIVSYLAQVIGERTVVVAATASR